MATSEDTRWPPPRTTRWPLTTGPATGPVSAKSQYHGTTPTGSGPVFRGPNPRYRSE